MRSIRLRACRSHRSRSRSSEPVVATSSGASGKPWASGGLAAERCCTSEEFAYFSRQASELEGRLIDTDHRQSASSQKRRAIGSLASMSSFRAKPRQRWPYPVSGPCLAVHSMNATVATAGRLEGLGGLNWCACSGSSCGWRRHARRGSRNWFGCAAVQFAGAAEFDRQDEHRCTAEEGERPPGSRLHWTLRSPLCCPVGRYLHAHIPLRGRALGP
jgi:hypothetical protein